MWISFSYYIQEVDSILILYTGSGYHSYTIYRKWIAFLYYIQEVDSILILYTGSGYHSYTIYRKWISFLYNIQEVDIILIQYLRLYANPIQNDIYCNKM